MTSAQKISAPTQKKQAIVGDTRFDNVTMSEAVEHILDLVQNADAPQYICTGNLDHLALLQKDHTFQEIYSEAALVLADGMPIVWLSHLNPDTAPLAERVAGSDLLFELCRASAWTGTRLFFLGGLPEAAERAAVVLRERFPGVHICGTYCPPKETFQTQAEQEKIAQKVRQAAPDILLVGFGAPKQEKWIARYKVVLGVPVSIGVGGSFEMAAGMVRRAPRWIQKIGMEWGWRLMQDPKRLYKRYICRDMPLLAHLVLEGVALKMGLKKPKPRPIKPTITESKPLSPKVNITMAPAQRSEPTEVRAPK